MHPDNTKLNNLSQVFKNPTTHHSFDVELANTLKSVDLAILVHHFQHWINYNKSLNRNYIEGRTWTYQTREEIAAHFPYWSIDQVRRYTDILVKKGILIKGNFNKKLMDKTLWYAFKDEEIFTSGNFAKSSGNFAKCTGEFAKAIPHTIPHTKPNISTTTTKPPPENLCDEPQEDSIGGGGDLENISLKNSKGEVITKTASEIYKFFLSSGFDTEIIQEAIREAKKSTYVVNDIFSYLYSICERLIKSKTCSKRKKKTSTESKPKNTSPVVNYKQYYLERKTNDS